MPTPAHSYADCKVHQKYEAGYAFILSWLSLIVSEELINTLQNPFTEVYFG